MLARELMTTPVVTVAPGTPVKEAIQLLDRNDITAMPVVDEFNRLIGIVSEADLLRGAVLPDTRGHVRPADDLREPAGRFVADVMTRGVMTVHQGTDAADIARLMLDTGVKSVPVTSGSKVVGIVSRRDLIRALATSDDRIQAEIHTLFAEAGLDGMSATVTDGTVALSGHGSERDVRIAAILARSVAGVVDIQSPPTTVTLSGGE